MENNTNFVNETQAGVWVEISRITVPEDVRKHTPEDIDSRARSMAREGQLENILLSKEGDQLVLVYGNGRLESAKKLGWDKIRADVKEGLSESQKLMMTLAENEEREDASPFYTAGVYDRLMKAKGLTQAQLAIEIGKTQQFVGIYLSLLGVPPEVRQNTNAFVLSLRQCLAIAKLTKVEDQLQVMKECAEEGLAGKALGKRIKALLNPAAADPPAKEPKAVPDFQFKWKDRQLVIKVRPFRTDQEGLSAYLEELGEACRKYMDAVPAPEPKSEEAPAAIAA